MSTRPPLSITDPRGLIGGLKNATWLPAALTRHSSVCTPSCCGHPAHLPRKLCNPYGTAQRHQQALRHRASAARTGLDAHSAGTAPVTARLDIRQLSPSMVVTRGQERSGGAASPLALLDALLASNTSRARLLLQQVGSHAQRESGGQWTQRPSRRCLALHPAAATLNAAWRQATAVVTCAGPKPCPCGRAQWLHLPARCHTGRCQPPGGAAGGGGAVA